MPDEAEFYAFTVSAVMGFGRLPQALKRLLCRSPHVLPQKERHKKRLLSEAIFFLPMAPRLWLDTWGGEGG
jgi:hypothetical protein